MVEIDADQAGEEQGKGREMKTFGAWREVRRDPTGKRVVVQCACGSTQIIATEVLEAGGSVGCGCRLTPKRDYASGPRLNSFVQEAQWEARRRQWGRT